MKAYRLHLCCKKIIRGISESFFIILQSKDEEKKGQTLVKGKTLLANPVFQEKNKGRESYETIGKDGKKREFCFRLQGVLILLR